MDYESTDKLYSSWVVGCDHNGTRFFIADNPGETATDMLSQAKIFRYQDQAEECAERNRAELGRVSVGCVALGRSHSQSHTGLLSLWRGRRQQH